MHSLGRTLAAAGLPEGSYTVRLPGKPTAASGRIESVLGHVPEISADCLERAGMAVTALKTQFEHIVGGKLIVQCNVPSAHRHRVIRPVEIATIGLVPRIIITALATSTEGWHEIADKARQPGPYPLFIALTKILELKPVSPVNGLTPDCFQKIVRRAVHARNLPYAELERAAVRAIRRIWSGLDHLFIEYTIAAPSNHERLAAAVRLDELADEARALITTP